MKSKILAVDDEVFNLDILKDYLEGEGFEVVCAEDGEVAMQKLEEHPDIKVIVLDRMMPKLNGMEVLQQVKANPRLKDIPIIMQTAAASSHQILEGIQAGVYYYLTKPYEDVMLISIVKAALHDATNLNEMREEVRKHRRVLGLMESSRFRFRTLEEAKNLAYFIANCLPNPESVVYGLSELMINAIEHGNLGISYDEKTTLVREGKWGDEVQRRLKLPDNLTKYAYLQFETGPSDVKVRIKDQGTGFNWKNYLEISPERASDPHGRGIAITRMIGFSSVEYMGNGNEVVCVLSANANDSAKAVA